MIISIKGLFKNHGMEWVSSWKAWQSLPQSELHLWISGVGFGEDALRLFFEGASRLADLPWILGYILQVGYVGVILLAWLWLSLLAGFLSDLLSSRADQQWIGLSGLGVMMAIFSSSFFSFIELGNITLPATFVLSTLFGLKRYLKMV
jgi:hypothetical protein